jgi:hypothetical protein
MWDRRRFLSRSGLALLGTAGTCLAFPGDGADAREEGASPLEKIPDGSASKGMITPRTDQAIQRGLAFLAARRGRDGSFGTRGYTGNVAVTSLAAMACMCAGSQPNRGPYGRLITEALRYVLSKENVAGGHSGFLHNPHASPHGPMYGHGFATLFLAESSGMVHDKVLRREVREKLHRAVRLIVRAQNWQGGWRYTPSTTEADLSVTICQIMALRAAKNAGVAVPTATVERCVKYVKACQNRGPGLDAGSFRYMLGHNPGGGHGFARTAAGVVALYSAGIYKGPEVEAGLRYLMRHKPGTSFLRHDWHYFYGHYYAVQAMWTAGGTYWSEWYPAIRDELLSRQNPDGSWIDPICTHYGTSMACIILQVPNNMLPILQK